MTIDPAGDVWVWAACALFLALLGARAIMAENGSRRVGRATRAVSVLTVACVLSAGLVMATAWVQGGGVLVTAIVTGSDPLVTVVPGDSAPVGDPGAPAAPNPLPVGGG